MQHETRTFNGGGNVSIFTQHWLPEGTPRGLVVLAHGYGEHSGRYAHVGAYLTGRGYALCALDHRGHGRSGGPRVQLQRFEEYIDDFATYIEQVRAGWPGLPLFVYGHSMGSLIALGFALHHPDGLAGVITTGTALRLPANLIITPLVRGLNQVAPRLRLVPLDLDGLSRDPAVAAHYRADPLVVHGAIPIQIIAELLRMGEQCAAELGTLRVPLLALHGQDDPICLVASTEIIRQQSGAPETRVKVYPGLRHEIHNEPEQAQILQDMGEWLDAHLFPADPF